VLVYYEGEKLGNLYHTIDHIAATIMNEWNEFETRMDIARACLTVTQTHCQIDPQNVGVSNI